MGAFIVKMQQSFFYDINVTFKDMKLMKTSRLVKYNKNLYFL